MHATPTHLAALAAVLALLVACSSSPSSGDVSADGSAAQGGSAGTSGSGSGGSAGTAGSAGTGGAGATGGAGGADAGVCAPSSGTQHFDLSCARSSGGFAEQVAVITSAGKTPRLRVMGRGLGAHSSCDLIDHVTVTRGGATLASFDVPGTPISAATWGAVEGDATSDAVAACADDAQRFDAATLEITGRTDGGTFTMLCGATGGPGSGWPAQLVLTCHDGIEPPIPDAIVRYENNRTALQVELPHAQPVTISGIDAAAHLIVGNAPYSPATAPFDTTGWKLVFFADVIVPQGANLAYLGQLSVDNPGDVLGALCLPPSIGGPPPQLPSALIARVHGSASTGAFSTEIYSEGCYRPGP